MASDGSDGEDGRYGGVADDTSLQDAVFTDCCAKHEHLEAPVIVITTVLSDVDVRLS